MVHGRDAVIEQTAPSDYSKLQKLLREYNDGNPDNKLVLEGTKIFHRGKEVDSGGYEYLCQAMRFLLASCNKFPV